MHWPDDVWEKKAQAHFPGLCDSPIWYECGVGVSTGIHQEILVSEFEGLSEEVLGSSLRATRYRLPRDRDVSGRGGGDPKPLGLTLGNL